MEILISLKPDLVIHQSQSDRMSKNTETLGIPTMEITMETLDDILSSIKLLGNTLGAVKGSEQLLKKLTAGINFYKNKLKDRTPKETLLLLGDSSDPGRDLYATGPGTFLHELLEISGGKNILNNSMAKYPRLSKEYIIEKSPEVIIEAGPKSRLTPEQIEKRLLGWKRFPSIRAVKKDKVHYIGADYMLIPGPRFLNILEQFSRAMHPDIFHSFLNSELTEESVR
jgi:iron complex transport system substrate-binding protein